MPASMKTIGLKLSNFAAPGPMPHATDWYVWLHSDEPLNLRGAVGKMYAALPPTGLEQFVVTDVPRPALGADPSCLPYVAQFGVLEDGDGREGFSSHDWLLRASWDDGGKPVLSLAQACHFFQRWQKEAKNCLEGRQEMGERAGFMLKSRFGQETCVSHVWLMPACLLCLPMGADPRRMAPFYLSGERLTYNNGPLRMSYR